MNLNYIPPPPPQVRPPATAYLRPQAAQQKDNIDVYLDAQSLRTLAEGVLDIPESEDRFFTLTKPEGDAILPLPPELAQGVLQQGSITVNGISLTVARLHEPALDGSRQLEIAIIPHTWRVTNLHTLEPGDPVNIETDILARYARNANQAWVSVAEEAGEAWLTTEYLLATGY